MKRRTLVGVLLAMLLALIPALPALAGTSADVTVTAAPAYVDISSTPTTWILNGITGGGKISPDTTYYANPLGDTTPPNATVAAGDCYFDLTDNSTVNIDLFVNCTDFSGGSANMTNSNVGTNGVGIYGGHSWYAGLLYSSKVIMKSSASSVLKTAHSGALDWGAEILTQTDAWAGGTSSTATMTISAQAS